MALTKIDDRGLKTPIDLLDNEKIRLGTGNDFAIYHSGSENRIEISNGNFFIDAVTQNEIMFTHDSKYMFRMTPDAGVRLYYDNVVKLETISGGVTVTGSLGLGSGDLTLTGNVDLEDSTGAGNNRIKLGTGDDLQIYHDGTNSYINNNTGDLVIKAAFPVIKGANDETILTAGQNGAVELYHNNVKTFETTSAGATIHRDLTLNHASGDTALRWAVGGTNKFSLYESSGTLRFYDNTNSAERMRIASNGKIGIGTDSPTRYLHVKETSGGDAQIIVETTANAERAQIEFKSPHATWVTGTYGGNTTGDWLTYTAGDHDAVFHQNGSEKFRIKGDGDVEIKDGDLVIGTAGHGIDFSSTGDGTGSSQAELFSDYETGTWSPANQYLTMSNIYAQWYTRVGNVVTCGFDFQYAASPADTSQTGSYIEGLPFTANAPQHSTAQYAVFNADFTPAPSLSGQIIYAATNGTNAYIYYVDGGRKYTRDEMAGKRVIGTFTYHSDY